MRSRSSRLFVILLHLVGCPQHFHNTFEGIVGVQPWPIVLETLSFPSRTNTTSSEESTKQPRQPSSRLSSAFQRTKPSEQYPEPVWIQDVSTQTCLGPQGTFTSDCGDATLWLPVLQPIQDEGSVRENRRQRSLMGIHGIEEDDEFQKNDPYQQPIEEGLVFYLVDRDVDDMLEMTLPHYHNKQEGESAFSFVRKWFGWTTKTARQQQSTPYTKTLPLECLTHDPINNTVSIQRCDTKGLQYPIPKFSVPPQWAWHVPNSSGGSIKDLGNTDASLRPFLLSEGCAVSASLGPRVKAGSRCDRESTPCYRNSEVAKEQRKREENEKVEFSYSASSTQSRSESLCVILEQQDHANPSTITKPPSFSFSQRYNIGLAECHENTDGIDDNHGNSGHQVELTMVRCFATPVKDPTLVGAKMNRKKNTEPGVDLNEQNQALQIEESTGESNTNGDSDKTKKDDISPTPLSSLLLQNRDLAHLAALDWSMHPELPTRPRLMLERRQQQKNDEKVGEDGGLTETKKFSGNSKSRIHVEIKRNERLATLHNANPILLVRSSSERETGGFPVENKEQHQQPQMSSSLHYRKRRIPVHPYIAASQNEIWTDPQTGLEYPTDLSSYLGYDKHEKGRHTLMGVGQYRKGYVIKVYGIAYYVSKRDVLADSFFEKYADLTAEELREPGKFDEFYDHLRFNPENFERSLFIKTNMQLSSEAIRGSLQADWSMLTDEAKDLILEASMKPQPVDDRTLAIIQDSAKNPSKCSCESIAPEHYRADPSCCARGTELVFTWLKNGDFVCRLNGRVVDTFARPDIAEGIFFEYLRNDNPISKEFHDNVVEGFPFLLAPLAQVQDIQQHASSAIPKSSITLDGDEGSDSHPGFIGYGMYQSVSRALTHFGEAATSQVSALSEGTHRSFVSTVGHLHNATRIMLDSAKSMSDGFGKDMNRRREVFIKRASTVPDMVVSTVKRNPVHTMQDIVGRLTSIPSWAKVQFMRNFQHTSDETDNDVASSTIPATATLKTHPMNDRRRLLLLSRWLGDVYYYAPDEIGPMIIHPTMNMTRKIFLFLVHLYLLLLFIVSFPGSYSTRTKFVYCRKTRTLRRLSSSSSVLILEGESGGLCYDEDEEGDFDEEEEDEYDDHDAMISANLRNSHGFVSGLRRGGRNVGGQSSKLPFSPRCARKNIVNCQDSESNDSYNVVERYEQNHHIKSGGDNNDSHIRLYQRSYSDGEIDGSPKESQLSLSSCQIKNSGGTDSSFLLNCDDENNLNMSRSNANGRAPSQAITAESRRCDDIDSGALPKHNQTTPRVIAAATSANNNRTAVTRGARHVMSSLGLDVTNPRSASSSTPLFEQQRLSNYATTPS